MDFYTRYDPPPREVGATEVEGESMTKQEFKDECDINRIMAKYRDEVPQIAGNPLYGDFSSEIDFQAAQEVMLRANSQFNTMPSDVRDRFSNDPVKFLRFINDPSNKDECRKMGLFKPAPVIPEKPAPMEVVVVSGNFPNDGGKPK